MEVWKKLKIVQIENGFVHWDATNMVPDLEWAASHYAENILFVEAPNYVFEGWGFDNTKEGDNRFVKPIPPEGWLYDDKTGTFYQKDMPLYQHTLKTDAINILNTI